MKKRKFHLLCLVAVLVSLFALSQVSFTTSPPALDPNEVQYYDSDEVYWRPNAYVDIRYADDLYWYAIDTNWDNQIVLNETVTLFNLTAISSSNGTATFTASGRDAQYNFTWSPTNPNTQYVKSVEGVITSFTINDWYSANSTLISVVEGTGSATYKVYWETMNGSVRWTNGNGTILNAQDYYDGGTKIITIPFTFSSSVTLSIYIQSGAPPPPPPPGIFSTQALEDYNTALMNNGFPYITGSTNTITALVYDDEGASGGVMTFTVTGSSGTTGTVTVYCADKEEPYAVSGVTSQPYAESTRILTLNVTFSSDQEVMIDWSVTPSTLIDFVRGNYYLVLGLLGLVPVVIGATMIIGMAKGRDTVTANDMYALVSIFIMVALAFIVIVSVMNALIGG